jgi:hypothetical protein
VNSRRRCSARGAADAGHGEDQWLGGRADHVRHGQAPTLRAYISRGNSEVPLPQATVGGRDQWARAVAQDWVEARQRSYAGVGEAITLWALRSALSLDGELTKPQRETYFALLEPHGHRNMTR